MKQLEQIKERIGKSKDMTEEGIELPKERFQRVFLGVYEGIEKMPKIIKNLFLSNFVYRTLSYAIFHSIDGRSTSFFKEKIRSGTEKYSVTSAGTTYVSFDSTLVRRSKAIGVEIYNDNSNLCNVDIQAGDFMGSGVVSFESLYHFTVQPTTHFFFQFDSVSMNLRMDLKLQSGSGDVYVIKYYLPL